MSEEKTTQPVVEEKKEEKKEKAAPAPRKQQKYYRTAKGKRRAHTSVPRGRAYIQATLNNTIVSITDQNGNVLAWASAGNCGFRGPKRRLHTQLVRL